MDFLLPLFLYLAKFSSTNKTKIGLFCPKCRKTDFPYRKSLRIMFSYAIFNHHVLIVKNFSCPYCKKTISNQKILIRTMSGAVKRQNYVFFVRKNHFQIKRTLKIILLLVVEQSMNVKHVEGIISILT